MHRVIADYCQRTHTIQQIASHLETISEKQAMVNEMSRVQTEFTNLVRDFEEAPFVTELVSVLTPHANPLLPLIQTDIIYRNLLWQESLVGLGVPTDEESAPSERKKG